MGTYRPWALPRVPDFAGDGAGLEEICAHSRTWEPGVSNTTQVASENHYIQLLSLTPL